MFKSVTLLGLLIGSALAEDRPLTFYPSVLFEHHSQGSIYTLHPESSSLFEIGLRAEINRGPLQIDGQFLFTSAKNLNHKTTFFNPELNLEMNRSYFGNDQTWFESSDLKMAYQQDSFEAYLGKMNPIWGQGRSSLILSNNAPSFFLGGFLWDITKKLRLEYFNGSISSQIVDTTSTPLYDNVGSRDRFYSRNIAAHRLTWRPFPTITFNAMELVIYGNRDIEKYYLLPFIPFWSTQRLIGDTDNVQMCGEIIWALNPTQHIYASLLIDEWRPEWTFNTKNRNWFGYQIGFLGKPIANFSGTIRMEYTWTDHRVYRHRFPINDATSYQYSLGFWAGPHAEEVYLSYDSNIKEIKFLSSISWAKRGQLTQEMLENQYNNVTDERYDGNVESRLHIQCVGKKLFLHNRIELSLGINYVDWVNAGFDPTAPEALGNDVQKFSVNIGLSAMTDIIFD